MNVRIYIIFSCGSVVGWPNPSNRTMALRLTQLWQKWVPGIFLGGKGRPARKADNLAAICGPIV
jgi:hypothetical protein